jgi:hypothetical protein
MLQLYHHARLVHPQYGCWMPHNKSAAPVSTAFCTRHVFESTARHLVAENERVEFVYGAKAVGLQFEEAAAAAAADAGGPSSQQQKAVTGGLSLRLQRYPIVKKPVCPYGLLLACNCFMQVCSVFKPQTHLYSSTQYSIFHSVQTAVYCALSVQTAVYCALSVQTAVYCALSEVELANGCTLPAALVIDASCRHIAHWLCNTDCCVLLCVMRLQEFSWQMAVRCRQLWWLMPQAGTAQLPTGWLLLATKNRECHMLLPAAAMHQRTCCLGSCNACNACKYSCWQQGYCA